MSGYQASLAKCPYCPGLYQQLHIHLSSSCTCREPSGGIFVHGAKVCIPVPNKTKPKKAIEEDAEHSQFNGLSDMEFPPGFRNIYPLAHPKDATLPYHVKNNTYSDNESDAVIGDMLDYMDGQGDDTVNMAKDDIIFNGKLLMMNVSLVLQHLMNKKNYMVVMMRKASSSSQTIAV